MKRQHKQLFNISLSLFTIVSLAACGGGNKSNGLGDTPVDTVAPLATNFSPANNTNAVDTNVSIIASFNELMFATAITKSSFTLKNSQDEVLPASVYFDDTFRKVILRPTAELAPLSTYTATLSSDFIDRAGNPLKEISWQFTTRNERSTKISSTSPGSLGSPQIAIDANGNALVVWVGSSQFGGNFLYSNRYNYDTGWETDQRIFTKFTSDSIIQGTQITFDSNGNAMTVLSLDDQTDDIWSIRYNKDTGWEPAQLLVADNRSFSPQIAFVTNGNALAVWGQYDGTRKDIWSNRYIKDTGWETAQNIVTTNNTADTLSPQIITDTNGNALTVWSQFDGSFYNFWSNHYNQDTGWENAQLFHTGGFDLQLAMDASGNALAVWAQSNGVRSYAWSNQYSKDIGWGTPQRIENDPVAGHARRPQITMNSNGSALAVWEKFNGTLTALWSSLYNKDTGWETPQLIEAEQLIDSRHFSINNSSFQIAIDTDGNAFVVWRKDNGGRYDIMLNRYNKDRGWGTAQLIAEKANSPQIAIDTTTNKAFVTWLQGGAIRVNIFEQ